MAQQADHRCKLWRSTHAMLALLLVAVTASSCLLGGARAQTMDGQQESDSESDVVMVSGATIPDGTIFNGTVFYFDTPQDGGEVLANTYCGYAAINSTSYPGVNVVGLSAESPFVQGMPQQGCGTCLRITCIDTRPGACQLPAQGLVVEAVDRCDSCGPHDLNIARPAFASIGSTSLGHVAVQYQQVPCSPPGNIIVHLAEYRNTSGGYIKLSLRNVAGSAGLVEAHLTRSGLQDQATSPRYQRNIWRRMDNVIGGVWEFSGLPPPPYDLKLVAIDGREVVLRNAIPSGATPGDYLSSGQLPATAPTDQVQDGVGTRP